MFKATYRLFDERARLMAIHAVRAAPLGRMVVIQDMTRSQEQNARFHALLGAIVKSEFQFAGRTLDLDEWKSIFVSGYLTAKKREIEFGEGLEGEFVIFRRSTTTFTVEEMSELMEYISAWMATNGIPWDGP